MQTLKYKKKTPWLLSCLALGMLFLLACNEEEESPKSAESTSPAPQALTAAALDFPHEENACGCPSCLGLDEEQAQAFFENDFSFQEKKKNFDQLAKGSSDQLQAGYNVFSKSGLIFEKHAQDLSDTASSTQKITFDLWNNRAGPISIKNFKVQAFSREKEVSNDLRFGTLTSSETSIPTGKSALLSFDLEVLPGIQPGKIRLEAILELEDKYYDFELELESSLTLYTTSQPGNAFEGALKPALALGGAPYSSRKLFLDDHQEYDYFLEFSGSSALPGKGEQTYTTSGSSSKPLTFTIEDNTLSTQGEKLEEEHTYHLPLRLSKLDRKTGFLRYEDKILEVQALRNPLNVYRFRRNTDPWFVNYKQDRDRDGNSNLLEGVRDLGLYSDDLNREVKDLMEAYLTKILMERICGDFSLNPDGTPNKKSHAISFQLEQPGPESSYKAATRYRRVDGNSRTYSILRIELVSLDRDSDNIHRNGKVAGVAGFLDTQNKYHTDNTYLQLYEPAAFLPENQPNLQHAPVNDDDLHDILFLLQAPEGPLTPRAAEIAFTAERFADWASHVMSHEIGHSVGLDHEPNEWRTLMHPNSSYLSEPFDAVFAPFSESLLRKNLPGPGRVIPLTSGPQTAQHEDSISSTK